MASLLAQHKVDALLVTNLTNIRYLSGCSVSAGRILITPRAITLYVDSRYSERAHKEAKKSIHIRSLEVLMDDLRKLRKLGMEADDMTLSQLERMKRNLKNKKLVHTSGFIEGLRRSKKDEELQAIRKACSITKAILRRIPSFLRPGISEQELAWKIWEEAHRHGCTELAFPSIVGFGSHTSIPHHEPTERTLKKGDLVQIDMGVKWKGYCSDESRVFFTADPTLEQRNVYRALQKAKKIAENMIRVGITNHALDEAARTELKKRNLDEYFTHALGHGVGLDIHEGITLSKRAPLMTLLSHEVITIEPGVYFPGKWGMRIEDTIIVP